MGLDPSPASGLVSLLPSYLSELGICLPASSERATPCSLLQDLGPGPQKGAIQSHSDATRAAGGQEERPVGLHWERYLPTSSQPLRRNQEFRMRWKMCR